MTWLLILTTGALVGAGVYLLLHPDRLRMVFGLVLLSTGVNLLILTVGRVHGPPALVPPGATTLDPGAAPALPQALVLTAIVIGLGVMAYLLVLLFRVAEQDHTSSVRDPLTRPEPVEDAERPVSAEDPPLVKGSDPA